MSTVTEKRVQAQTLIWIEGNNLCDYVSQSEVQQVHLLSEMMVCIVVVNPYVIVRPGSLHMNEKC